VLYTGRTMSYLRQQPIWTLIEREKLVDVVIDVIDYQSWLDVMTPLVTKRCAAQLKKPVAEKLKKNDSTSFRKGACQVLAGQADVSDALKICEG